jgi:FAD-dependent urate hydroxylase
MESWRRFMPEGMLLRSEPFASNLWDPKRRFTYECFCAERGFPYRPVRDPIRLALFLEYAEWFRQHAVGDVVDAKVVRIGIERRGGSFLLELAQGGSVSARQVVLATGHMAHAYIPPELSKLPDSVCVHSSRMAAVRSFAGRKVAIVGAGQSALETAALLREAGARVHLLTRRIKSIRWNDGPNPNPSLLDRLLKPEAGVGAGWSDMAISELPFLFRRLFAAEKRHRFFADAFGPAGAWWLRERVQGVIEIYFEHSIRSAGARNGGVCLLAESPGGAREIDVDQVVAATGYKLDLGRLDYLDPTLNAAIAREGSTEFPLLDGSFETSVPGLFIVGMASAPTFGPVMRFMFGAKHTAPEVARRLVKRAGSSARIPALRPPWHARRGSRARFTRQGPLVRSSGIAGSGSSAPTLYSHRGRCGGAARRR